MRARTERSRSRWPRPASMRYSRRTLAERRLNGCRSDGGRQATSSPRTRPSRSGTKDAVAHDAVPALQSQRWRRRRSGSYLHIRLPEAVSLLLFRVYTTRMRRRSATISTSGARVGHLSRQPAVAAARSTSCISAAERPRSSRRSSCRGSSRALTAVSQWDNADEITSSASRHVTEAKLSVIRARSAPRGLSLGVENFNDETGDQTGAPTARLRSFALRVRAHARLSEYQRRSDAGMLGETDATGSRV